MTSQINTANINTAYPVAGVDNDSQGFRDNFLNIKAAVDVAASEITNLQLASSVKSVVDFGAHSIDEPGYSDFNSTTAFQDAISYCESDTQYSGKALYIPGGRYRITESLVISKEFITIFGDGPWASQIFADDLATPAIETATMTYLRPFLHDFGIVNSGAGKGIDFGNIAGQVYLGELKNLYLESGDDGFYAPHFFSMSVINVSSLSRSGHSFRVRCGPGVNWIGCYALTCGLGKAGYRLAGSILMNACNGLNDGDYWGVFGNDTASNDGFEADFNDTDYPDITLLNCNVEHFGSLTTDGEGIRVQNAYRSFNMIGGKFDRADLTTAYQAIVHCLASSNGGTEPVRLGVGYVFKGTGVPSLAYLYSDGQAAFFDTNDTFYQEGITSFKQSSTIYPILRQWVYGDIYGDNAHYFSAISPRRTSLQMVRYAEPAALTPVGQSQAIVVTGYTKVVVAPVTTASIATATFDATPNTVSDYGRNGDLLIEAGTSHLTITHSTSGANTFNLAGGIDLTMAAGQVVRFCRSDTGSNWSQDGGAGRISGTYLPVRTYDGSGNMVTAIPSDANYFRVGDMVSVSGSVVVRTSAYPGVMRWYQTLPIASNILSSPNPTAVFGTYCGSETLLAGSVLGSTLTNQVWFIGDSLSSTTGSATTIYYNYTYKVI